MIWMGTVQLADFKLLHNGVVFNKGNDWLYFTQVSFFSILLAVPNSIIATILITRLFG